MPRVLSDVCDLIFEEIRLLEVLLNCINPAAYRVPTVHLDVCHPFCALP